MKPTDSIDLGVTREIQDLRTQGVISKGSEIFEKDQDVFIAEQAVQRSISRFENVMEHLAQKAEVTHDKVQYQVQHTQHLIHLPKQKLNELDAKFAHWARLKSYAIEDGIRQIVRQIKFGTRETIHEVRTNPVPYAWAAGIAGLFAGLLIATGFATESLDDEEEERDVRLDGQSAQSLAQIPAQPDLGISQQYNF